MVTAQSESAELPQRRYGWRLKALLALTALLLCFFMFSRITPQQAKQLGPWAQSLYEEFNPPAVPGLSQSRRELQSLVTPFGGEIHLMGRTPALLFGGTELFSIRVNGTQFGNNDLASLLKKHRHQIWGLDLRNTNVTNDGLVQLAGMPNLQQLTLGNEVTPYRKYSPPESPITDAGLVHLRKLDELRNLTLSGLPITDLGLRSIEDLPNLGGLYLSRTKVKGSALGQLKSLPKLAVLYLDHSELTDGAMSQLRWASNLQVLSLNRVVLTGDGLKPLKTLPRLRHLEVTGCGLLDEEVEDLQVSMPQLKIVRQ